jgi:hypothetical protein
LNLDQWFLRQVESSIRKGPSGEKTADCVNETFLKSYAEEPTDFSLADDRVKHVASCSYCMGCLLELRSTRQAKGSRRVRYIAVGWLALASMVVGGIVDFVLHHWRPEVVHVQEGELQRTLDLSRQLATKVPLHLPAALLRVEIVLPQRSQAGEYDIAVAAQGTAGKFVAHAKGHSTGAGQRVAVTVSVDLRNIPPGKYELAAQLQGETASYLYPLEIDRMED